MTLFERKQQALKLIAFASLKYNDEPIELDNIRAETSRIARIVADEYVHSSTELDFNKFVLNWIKKHGEEVVKTDRWTYDIEIPDDRYQMDVNVLIDKMHRKAAKVANVTAFI